MSKEKNEMVFQPFGDMKAADGRTFREHNLEIQHKIPIGTLVHTKWSTWYTRGACMRVEARLFVLSHDRDCDGTPLYSLCSQKGYEPSRVYCGMPEEFLTPIEITPEIASGDDVLDWPEDQ